MTNKAVQIQKILKATGKNTLEEAAEIVSKGLTIAAKQDYILSHLAAVTIVYSPAGLMSFTVSPEAGMSLEHLSMIESAVLEFQQALVKRRQELMAQQAQARQPRPVEQPVAEGEQTQP